MLSRSTSVAGFFSENSDEGQYCFLKDSAAVLIANHHLDRNINYCLAVCFGTPNLPGRTGEQLIDRGKVTQPNCIIIELEFDNLILGQCYGGSHQSLSACTGNDLIRFLDSQCFRIVGWIILSTRILPGMRRVSGG